MEQCECYMTHAGGYGREIVKCSLCKAAPALVEAGKEFVAGWTHFLNCINFSKSNLDADAIRFMNEVPGKIEQATIKAESED